MTMLVSCVNSTESGRSVGGQRKWLPETALHGRLQAPMRRLRYALCAGSLTLLTSCSGSVTVDGSNPLYGWNWGKIAIGVFLVFSLVGALQHVYEGKMRRATRKLGSLDDHTLLLSIALSDESSASTYKAVSGLGVDDAARLAVARLASLGAIKPLELVAEHSPFEHVRKLAATKLLLLGFIVSEGEEETEVVYRLSREALAKRPELEDALRSRDISYYWDNDELVVGKTAEVDVDGVIRTYVPGEELRQTTEAADAAALPYPHVDPWWKLGTGVSILALVGGAVLLVTLLAVFAGF